MADTALELRSLIKKSGELELSLAKVAVPEPGEDQVLVKVEATPINPSDLGLLLGPADMSARQGERQRRRHRGHGQGAIQRADHAGRAARQVDDGRQRGRGHGGEGGQLARRAGAERQDGVDGRRLDVRAVSPVAGERLPAAAGRHDGGRGRLVVRQSADRARHDRDDEARGPQGAGPYRGRLEPRPDAEQDLPERRHSPGQHRAQRPSRPACCAASAPSTSSTAPRPRSSTTWCRRWSTPAPPSPSTRSAAASSPARS